jgi:hypothetical protein
LENGKMKKVMMLVIVEVVFLAVAEIGIADISYNDFSSITGLNFVGQSQQVGNLILVAPALEESRGAVWYQERQPVTYGFTTEFSFQYDNISGNTDAHNNRGCDGIRFAIQPISNAIDGSFYDGLEIWFDAFDNAIDSYDFSSSRVEVSYLGTVLGQTDIEPMGIIYRDENVHVAKIEYDGLDLSIFLDSQAVVIYSGIDFSSIENSYIGFRGYGGGAYADLNMYDWNYTAIPEPCSLILICGGCLFLCGKRKRK